MLARLGILAVLFFGGIGLIAVPFGRYVYRVIVGENRFSARVFGPLERWIHRLAGVSPEREHTVRQYAGALLAFSLITQVVAYLVMRLQAVLPANPARLPSVPPWLAWNTATSFVTNTDWQSYAGEATMSYLTQALALTPLNFFSAASGMCVAFALLRGIARTETRTIGNCWVDLVRVHLYVLLPVGLIYALFLVSQGVIQTWAGPARWTTLDGSTQVLLRGPVASQEAIKVLGTNGGGFFNANSAHPWENPTPLTNFVQMVSMVAIPAALCVTLGEMVKNRRHGWALLAAMVVISLAGFFVVGLLEQRGNPLLVREGVNAIASALDPAGNMEGKEVRFGIPDSALFAVVTTDASCGAVNSMHESYLPLAGLVLMLNMQLGEVVFGGVGAGMYGILMNVLIAVFLAGLMVGRTPEYLGKKIDRRDIRLASMYILLPAFVILVLTAVGVMTAAGRAGMSSTAAAEMAGTTWRPAPHALSEVLYAFSSAVANNGSAFAGLTTYSEAHPVFYAFTLGLAMFLGRFPPMVAVLAIAGNMAQKKRGPSGPGSFPVEGALFTALLVAVVLVAGALTFFPVLSLGPIVEHFLLRSFEVR